MALRNILHSLLLIAFSVTVVAPMARAQNPLAPLTGASATPTKPADTPAADPLGRTTPRGTVIGFLQAAQSAHAQSAAQYFQQTHARHPANQDELVTQLKELLDRAYVGNINRISDAPEGTPQEGLAPDQERVGKLVVNGESADLLLVHVNDPVYGPIWLFSSESLPRFPTSTNRSRWKKSRRSCRNRCCECFWACRCGSGSRCSS